MELSLYYIRKDGTHIESAIDCRSITQKETLHRINTGSYIWYLDDKPITNNEYKIYKLLNRNIK